MKLVVVITILSLIRAEENLGVYVFNGVRHYKEILFENLSSGFNVRANSLAVDFSTNNLYVDYNDFSFLFIISTREYNYINAVETHQCITVDQVTHEVFIGASDGIYNYNSTTAEKELVGASGEDVLRILHYNGVLYYKKNTNKQEIRSLINGRSLSYHNVGFDTESFVIDNEENIVSITSNGSLYRYKKATKQYVVYEGISGVTSLTTDRNGNVYFSVDNGVYEVKRDVVERVLYIDNPKYIAFDGDNNLIYYSNKDSKLYRLKPIAKDTNRCSNGHTHAKKPDATDNNNCIACKIDHLAQIMVALQTKVDKLQSDIQQCRAIEREDKKISPRWIRLETGNIPVCRSEDRTGQVSA